MVKTLTGTPLSLKVTYIRIGQVQVKVKTLQKSSSPELVDRFQRNLVPSIDDSSTTMYIYINHDPVMTLTYFRASNWDNLPQSAKGRYQGVTWKITCADQISIVSHRLRCARCPILTPEGQLPI